MHVNDGSAAPRFVTAADVKAIPEWVPTAGDGLSLDELLQAIVDEVAQRSPWPRVGITLVDWERGTCTFIAQTGWNVEDNAKPVWPLGDGLSPLVLQTRRTIVLEDFLADQVYVPLFPRLYRDAMSGGFRSGMIVPLPMEPATYAMWFCGMEPHRFSEQEITYATTIAHFTAIAFRHAHLAHKEQQVNAALQQLTEANIRQRTTLERLLTDQNRLTKMVLDGQGLATIVGQVSEVLGNSVILYDKQFQQIVTPRGRTAGPPQGPPQGPTQACSGARFQKADGEIFHHLQSSLHPVIRGARPDLAINERRIIAPLVVGDDVLGYLYVLEDQRPFEELDPLIAQQVALVLALEFMKEQIACSVEMRLQSDVLSDLLFGGAPDERLLARAAILGLNVTGPSCLLLIRETSANEAVRVKMIKSLLDATTRALRDLPGRAVAVLQRGDVVVLREQSGAATDPTESAERLLAALERYLPAATLLIGIGGASQGLPEIRRVYNQAKRVLDAHAAVGSRGLVPLRDLGVIGLLAREETAADLVEFARSLLGGLIDYDTQHGTELVATLRAYLEQGGNLQKTTRSLFIHLSTLRYRLERIQAITRLDMRRPHDLFHCQLALQVYALFGQRLDPK